MNERHLRSCDAATKTANQAQAAIHPNKHISPLPANDRTELLSQRSLCLARPRR